MCEVLVSIDCITYNHEKFIREAINGFLMQKTNFKFEILIHDDASTDKTASIIKEYQKKYPDIIKPILQKENQYSKGVKGINYVYNLSRASGKYIAICEGDDYWTDPCKLQKQVDYMEKHPDCSLCFHAAEIEKVGIGKIGEIRPYNKDCISTTEDIISGGGGFMATNSILYRKDIMKNVPNFITNASIGDYPLQIYASTKNYAYYMDDFMSAYRTGVVGSWSRRMSSRQHKVTKLLELTKEINILLNKFDEYSKKKYSNVIQKKIVEDEFEILIATKRLREMKDSRYDDLYKLLTYKDKIKIYARSYMPYIYEGLHNAKKVRNAKKLYGKK